MQTVYPNDSEDDITITSQLHNTIIDADTFLHSSFTTLLKQCIGNKQKVRKVLPSLVAQDGDPWDKYRASILINRLSRMPMMKVKKWDAIEGKRYKTFIYSDLMCRLNAQTIMCCICEREIQLQHVEEHSSLCAKKARIKQELINLQEQIHELSEDTSQQEIENITKMNIQAKRHQNSNQNSPMSSQALQHNIGKSKFSGERTLQRAKTINLTDESSPISLSFQRNRVRHQTRQFDSPDSQREIKGAISIAKVIKQYCVKMSKEEHIYTIENDVRTQSLIKLALNELNSMMDIHDLMKRCLKIIQQRIDLNKKLNKVEQLQKSMLNPQINRIKRSFQKGLSNSFKDNSTSSSRRNSTGKIRVMEMITSGKQAKSKFLQRFCQQKQQQQDDENGTLLRIDSDDVKTPSRQMDSEISLQMRSNEEFEDEEPEFIRGYYSDTGTMNKIPTTRSKIINIGLKDFEFKEILGVGAYGAVWKVRKIKTNDVYAMKVIDTREKNSKNFLKLLKAEKDVFQVIEGDFIAKAFYSFSQSECLFYVLEYVKGGDFDRILRKYGPLEESIARFYLAELLLAIEALHRKNIIHRDLKPQNILLDAKGHIKLTDFGLSEIGIQKLITNNEGPTYSKALELQELLKKNIRGIIPESPVKSPRLGFFTSPKTSVHKQRIVGTPDYIAPEVIQAKCITNESIDLWSFGILVYEFLIGIPPFNDDSPQKIFDNIVQRIIEWPEIGDGEDQLSSKAQDIIEKLLDLNYETRMTVEQAKQHPFFAGIDWNSIRNQVAPIIPDDDHEDSPLMQFRAQKEQEKLSKLLKDTSSDNSTISKLGVDNLLRLDLLVEMNQQKAREMRRRKYH